VHAAAERVDRVEASNLVTDDVTGREEIVAAASTPVEAASTDDVERVLETAIADVDIELEAVEYDVVGNDTPQDADDVGDVVVPDVAIAGIDPLDFEADPGSDEAFDEQFDAPDEDLDSFNDTT
jgi:hypothetical protein